VKSRRPYLLRAMHEWISESGCTPHLVVDAAVAGVDVPRQYVRDGKIILNVSWNATGQLELGNEELSFSGRFGGVSTAVRIPVRAVLAIYARETGQGMMFSEDQDGPGQGPSDGESASTAPQDEAKKRPRGRASLKVVK
jgi:stringent starvation protein B